MTSENQGITDKLLNLDSKWIHLAMLVLVVWPLVNPLFLPIPIGETTQGYFDAIESLEPGSVVFFCVLVEPGNIPEVGYPSVTTLNHIAQLNREENRDIKVVHFVTVRPDHAIVFDTYIKPRVDFGVMEYGKDWVFLGYVEGGTVAVRSFAEDTRIVETDYYGNDIDDLDLMDEVKSAEDFDLIIGNGADVVSQVAVPFNIRCIYPTTSWGWTETVANYQAGIIEGALNGIRGSAEYAGLAKIPSPSISAMDATNATHLFLLAVALITNGIYLARRLGGTAE
jgi:hypothetical protein